MVLSSYFCCCFYCRVQEQFPIMTFTTNSTDRLALVHCQQQGLHLWDLESKCKIRQYRGMTAATYTLHPCFGGVNESFVACGSEDNKVKLIHFTTFVASVFINIFANIFFISSSIFVFDCLLFASIHRCTYGI